MRTLLFIHLLGVAFWLGGQLFLLGVLVPALRRLEPAQRQALFATTGRWYGMVSIPVLVVILGTGIAMMSELGLEPSESTALQHKLTAVGVVLAATAVHSIAAARGARRVSRISSIVTLIATVAAVWFATGI
jgi:putative copper export protein